MVKLGPGLIPARFRGSTRTFPGGAFLIVASETGALPAIGTAHRRTSIRAAQLHNAAHAANLLL